MELFFGLRSIKLFIPFVNFVFRTICIKLVAWIGYKTKTEEILSTTKVCFAVQFFNTAFLLLLVKANLSEQPITFGLTGGRESDFSKNWYRTIGNTLTGTMIYIMMWPILEAFMWFSWRLFSRFLDRGCSTDPYKTRKTSI